MQSTTNTERILWQDLPLYSLEVSSFVPRDEGPPKHSPDREQAASLMQEQELHGMFFSAYFPVFLMIERDDGITWIHPPSLTDRHLNLQCIFKEVEIGERESQRDRGYWDCVSSLRRYSSCLTFSLSCFCWRANRQDEGDERRDMQWMSEDLDRDVPLWLGDHPAWGMGKREGHALTDS